MKFDAEAILLFLSSTPEPIKRNVRMVEGIVDELLSCSA